jgi:methionyl-tRNA formyltransferase
MHITFCGTPKTLGRDLLAGLLDLDLPITQVVTAPAKPVGRRKILQETPVAQLAQKRHLPLITFDRVDPEELEFFHQIQPDLIITSAFGVIFPPELLELPRLGCLNVHYSLLPEFRGTAPLQTALRAGRPETGVTLMLMDQGVDTGPILAQQTFPIGPHDLLEDLERRSVQTALELLPQTIQQLEQRGVTPQPQDNNRATHTRMIKKADGLINWSQSAQEIYNQYRAYHRWPGVFTFWQPQANKPPQKLTLSELKITSLENPPFMKGGQGDLLDSPQSNKSNLEPGTVIAHQKQLAVITGNSDLIVPQKMQLAGKKMLSAADFLRGYPGIIGSQLN